MSVCGLFSPTSSRSFLRCGNGCKDKHNGWDEMKDVDEKGEEVPAMEKGKELLQLRPGAEEKATSNSDYHPYPKAVASYQDVLASRNLFMETLEKLHSAMGTKFMVPIIGGKELDLHRLFTEVTSRGGFEKVVGEKRWREVTNVFNFPSTATNASFVLRKYYNSLLCHYEQIYFFEAKGWSSLPKPTLNTMLSTPIQLPYPETLAVSRKKRKHNGEVAQTGLVLPVNQTVDGVIDGKFEDGYFISVTVGSTKLKGVLFHTSEQNAAQAIPVSSGFPDNGSSKAIRHRRRRNKRTYTDPAHPKPNISGYNFFFAEQHARLKLLHPGKVREISKTIGDLWNKLTDAEKAVYRERGLKDKQRYQSELAVYKDRMRTDHVITNVMPIQQRPLDPDSMQSEVSTKVACEGNSHLSNRGDSGSEDGTDSDEEFELQTSPEAGEAATESARMGAVSSAEDADALEPHWEIEAVARSDRHEHRSFGEPLGSTNKQ